MPRIPRLLILFIVVGVLLALVWSRLRIVIFVPLSLGQAIMLFLVAALALYLEVDHLINRRRD